MCVIDIGSNTIRLVVYRVDSDGITPILNNKYTAGLAAYIGKDGALSDEGTDRLVDVMAKFRDATDLLPDCEVFPFATALPAQHHQPRGCHRTRAPRDRL